MLLSSFKRLKEEKEPIKFLWSRALWHSGFCTFFDINRKQYKLKFFPTALSASLYYDNTHGLEDELILKDLLKKGDVFVDIGANIGHLSLLASSIVGASGKVFSFEPHPKTHEYLQKNIQLNKTTNIITFNCGLGETPGYVSFTNSRSDDQNHILKEEGESLKIEVKTLDSVLNDLKINLLKVDTEGFEKFVFIGAKNVLKNTEKIYFETNEQNYHRYGYSVQDVLKLLSNYNFKFYNYLDYKWVPFNSKSPPPNNLLAKRN